MCVIAWAGAYIIAWVIAYMCVCWRACACQQQQQQPI